MDDQSHIFQLLFQEQIDEYKQSLTSIDDLFEQKQKKEEHPVTITVSFFCIRVWNMSLVYTLVFYIYFMKTVYIIYLSLKSRLTPVSEVLIQSVNIAESSFSKCLSIIK